MKILIVHSSDPLDDLPLVIRELQFTYFATSQIYRITYSQDYPVLRGKSYSRGYLSSMLAGHQLTFDLAVGGQLIVPTARIELLGPHDCLHCFGSGLSPFHTSNPDKKVFCEVCFGNSTIPAEAPLRSPLEHYLESLR